MTSNAGTKDLNKKNRMIGFGDRQIQDDTIIDKEIKKIFPLEFISRLNFKINYKSLSIENVISITKKEIKIIEEQAAENHISISIDEQTIACMAEEAFSAEYGVRNLKNIIRNKIISPIVKESYGSLTHGGKVTFEYNEKGQPLTMKILSNSLFYTNEDL